LRTLLDKLLVKNVQLGKGSFIRSEIPVFLFISSDPHTLRLRYGYLSRLPFRKR
jgi:hypothetical protein